MMHTTGFFETVEAVFHDWNYPYPKLLYALIRTIKPETVVEVGTYRGYAAAYMARAVQENNFGRVYCIDDFSLDDHRAKYGDPVLHWEGNLHKCGVLDWTKLLVGKSDSVEWPDKVDFAYIDGWHSYKAVYHDFNKCDNRGVNTIVFDDIISAVGPRQFVSELIEVGDWNVLKIYEGNGLAICTRKRVSPPVEFVQEFDTTPGLVIRGMGRELASRYLDDVGRKTGIAYSKEELL